MISHMICWRHLAFGLAKKPIIVCCPFLRGTLAAFDLTGAAGLAFLAGTTSAALSAARLLKPPACAAAAPHETSASASAKKSKKTKTEA